MLTNPPDSAPDIAVAIRSFSRRSCLMDRSRTVCLFVRFLSRITFKRVLANGTVGFRSVSKRQSTP